MVGNPYRIYIPKMPVPAHHPVIYAKGYVDKTAE
jgi:hypothetical protein